MSVITNNIQWAKYVKNVFFRGGNDIIGVATRRKKALPPGVPTAPPMFSTTSIVRLTVHTNNIGEKPTPLVNSYTAVILYELLGNSSTESAAEIVARFFDPD